MRITLDTNCLIDLEERRPSAVHLDALIAQFRAEKIQLCIPAISASERTKAGLFAPTFTAFESKLKNVGLERAELLLPLGYFDVTYWDHCLFGDGDKLEPQVHRILFPELPFAWGDYCKQTGTDVDAIASDRRWRNAKCDVLAIWSHIKYGADLFVTSDENFLKTGKKPELIKLGAKNIGRPDEALHAIRTTLAV